MTSSRPSERRQLTVMFCDIVDSTALSLRLDPEELADVIAMYRRESAKLIEHHGGMVARYDGDAILAYFGYPRAHENDAERAVRAALAIVNAQWPVLPGGALRVHAGIATGLVVVGRLQESGDYLAAIGSTTNLAARIQGIAAAGAVVVSDSTRRLTGGLFDYRDLGPQAMKGFDEPVPSWQVIGERTVGSRFHALHQSARTPLFDRQAEIAQLRALWSAVQKGPEGRALLISAEAGIGKSRLTEVVAEQIVGREVLRVWYHCLPNMQGSPLAPVMRQFAVAAGFGERDDDETKRTKLARLVPAAAPDAAEIVETLTGLLSLTKAPASAALAMSPQRQKQKLFAMLMRSLAAFATRGPLLLVVEDLHWIDPSSDELMGMLLEQLSELPILALFTARPEFRPHWPDTSRLGYMSPAPLGRTDSVAMIEALCGERPIGDDAVRQIAERTDGVPLFIEDLTRDVVEGAGLRARSASPTGTASFSVPATLHDSLMSRLDRLGAAKSVAETGAVIGREFSYELLAKVADMPEDDLRDELRRLVDAGLIVVQPSTPMLGYAFKHALVRDAAYAGLLNKTKAALHARIARALIEDFPDTAQSQPDSIAHHLQAANDLDNAADYLVKAAKLAARRSGFVEAIGQLERALALLGTQPRDESRLRREVNIYRTLGGIYAEYRGFASADCGHAYEAALERCRALGDAPEIFAVLSGVGSYAITRADFATCRALAQECLERAARQASKPPFVMGKLLLGGTLFLQGELPDARLQLDEALRLYAEIGQHRGGQVLYVQDQKSTALCYLALVQTIAGDLHAGIAAGEKGLAHSRSLGGPHAVNFSLCYLAAALHIAGDAAAALARAEQSIEEARERGFATWVGISRVVRGASLIERGRLDEGMAELDRGIEAHALTGAVAYQTFAHALHAEGLLAAGRPSEARSAVETAIALTEANGERFYAAELWRIRGDILAAAGDAGDAAQAFGDSVAIARRQGASLFERRSAERLARLRA